jgi:hypothetical protein
MTDGDVDAIVRAVVDKAKKGDLAACKLVLDRIAPAPKSRAVSLPLPVLGEYDGASTIIASYA